MATPTPILDRLKRPMHDLRISVIDACNFRCPYCMPVDKFPDHFKFLPKREWLNFDELVRLTKVFTQFGVTKVRLTGGEPLLRRQLPELVTALKAIPELADVALTTNGYYLAREAAALKAAGLDRLNVSLDAIDDTVFAQMNGRGYDTSRVREGIAEAKAVGFAPVKVNAVIKRGVNDHCLMKLVDYAREEQLILRFIEFMDVGNFNEWDRSAVVPSRDILAQIHEHYPLHAIDKNYRGEVADRYQYDDGGGEVGFISSVSQPFCGDCHRSRLTSNGKLYTCLFATTGHDLKEPLRDGASDEELAQIVADIWRGRTDRYSEERSRQRQQQAAASKVEMYHVGG